MPTSDLESRLVSILWEMNIDIDPGQLRRACVAAHVRLIGDDGTTEATKD